MTFIDIFGEDNAEQVKNFTPAHDISELDELLRADLKDIIVTNCVDYASKNVSSDVKIAVSDLRHDSGILFAKLRIEKYDLHQHKGKPGIAFSEKLEWYLELHQMPLSDHGRFDDSHGEGKRELFYRAYLKQCLNGRIPETVLDSLLDPIEISLQYISSVVSGEKRIWLDNDDGKHELSILNAGVEGYESYDNKKGTRVCIPIKHTKSYNYRRPDQNRVCTPVFEDTFID